MNWPPFFCLLVSLKFGIQLVLRYFRNGIDAAFQLWTSYGQNYRTSDGMHLLIRASLKQASLSAQEKSLSEFSFFCIFYTFAGLLVKMLFQFCKLFVKYLGIW